MQTINPPESALLVANRSSGHGRTDAELTHLQGAFDESFRAIPERVFQVADSHDHVAEITREFLRTHPTHVFLLAGGGGGTSLAALT